MLKSIGHIINESKISKSSLKYLSMRIYRILPSGYTQKEIAHCIRANLSNYSSDNCSPPQRMLWNSGAKADNKYTSTNPYYY